MFNRHSIGGVSSNDEKQQKKQNKKKESKSDEKKSSKKEAPKKPPQKAPNGRSSIQSSRSRTKKSKGNDNTIELDLSDDDIVLLEEKHINNKKQIDIEEIEEVKTNPLTPPETSEKSTQTRQHSHPPSITAGKINIDIPVKDDEITISLVVDDDSTVQNDGSGILLYGDNSHPPPGETRKNQNLEKNAQINVPLSDTLVDDITTPLNLPTNTHRPFPNPILGEENENNPITPTGKEQIDTINTINTIDTIDTIHTIDTINTTEKTETNKNNPKLHKIRKPGLPPPKTNLLPKIPIILNVSTAFNNIVSYRMTQHEEIIEQPKARKRNPTIAENDDNLMIDHEENEGNEDTIPATIELKGEGFYDILPISQNDAEDLLLHHNQKSSETNETIHKSGKPQKSTDPVVLMRLYDIKQYVAIELPRGFIEMTKNDIVESILGLHSPNTTSNDETNTQTNRKFENKPDKLTKTKSHIDSNLPNSPPNPLLSHVSPILRYKPHFKPLHLLNPAVFGPPQTFINSINPVFSPNPYTTSLMQLYSRVKLVRGFTKLFALPDNGLEGMLKMAFFYHNFAINLNYFLQSRENGAFGELLRFDESGGDRNEQNLFQLERKKGFKNQFLEQIDYLSNKTGFFNWYTNPSKFTGNWSLTSHVDDTYSSHFGETVLNQGDQIDQDSILFSTSYDNSPFLDKNDLDSPLLSGTHHNLRLDHLIALQNGIKHPNLRAYSQFEDENPWEQGQNKPNGSVGVMNNPLNNSNNYENPDRLSPFSSSDNSSTSHQVYSNVPISGHEIISERNIGLLLNFLLNSGIISQNDLSTFSALRNIAKQYDFSPPNHPISLQNTPSSSHTLQIITDMDDIDMEKSDGMPLDMDIQSPQTGSSLEANSLLTNLAHLTTTKSLGKHRKGKMAFSLKDLDQDDDDSTFGTFFGSDMGNGGSPLDNNNLLGEYHDMSELEPLKFGQTDDGAFFGQTGTNFEPVNTQEIYNDPYYNNPDEFLTHIYLPLVKALNHVYHFASIFPADLGQEVKPNIADNKNEREQNSSTEEIRHFSALELRKHIPSFFTLQTPFPTTMQTPLPNAFVAGILTHQCDNFGPKEEVLEKRSPFEKSKNNPHNQKSQNNETNNRRLAEQITFSREHFLVTQLQYSRWQGRYAPNNNISTLSNHTDLLESQLTKYNNTNNGNNTYYDQDNFSDNNPKDNFQTDQFDNNPTLDSLSPNGFEDNIAILPDHDSNNSLPHPQPWLHNSSIIPVHLRQRINFENSTDFHNTSHFFNLGVILDTQPGVDFTLQGNPYSFVDRLNYFTHFDKIIAVSNDDHSNNASLSTHPPNIDFDKQYINIPVQTPVTSTVLANLDRNNTNKFTSATIHFDNVTTFATAAPMIYKSELEPNPPALRLLIRVRRKKIKTIENIPILAKTNQDLLSLTYDLTKTLLPYNTNCRYQFNSDIYFPLHCLAPTPTTIYNIFHESYYHCLQIQLFTNYLSNLYEANRINLLSELTFYKKNIPSFDLMGIVVSKHDLKLDDDNNIDIISRNESKDEKFAVQRVQLEENTPQSLEKCVTMLNNSILVTDLQKKVEVENSIFGPEVKFQLDNPRIDVAHTNYIGEMFKNEIQSIIPEVFNNNAGRDKKNPAGENKNIIHALTDEIDLFYRNKTHRTLQQEGFGFHTENSVEQQQGGKSASQKPNIELKNSDFAFGCEIDDIFLDNDIIHAINRDVDNIMRNNDSHSLKIQNDQSFPSTKPGNDPTPILTKQLLAFSIPSIIYTKSVKDCLDIAEEVDLKNKDDIRSTGGGDNVHTLPSKIENKTHSGNNSVTEPKQGQNGENKKHNFRLPLSKNTLLDLRIGPTKLLPTLTPLKRLLKGTKSLIISRQNPVKSQSNNVSIQNRFFKFCQNLDQKGVAKFGLLLKVTKLFALTLPSSLPLPLLRLISIIKPQVAADIDPDVLYGSLEKSPKNEKNHKNEKNEKNQKELFPSHFENEEFVRFTFGKGLTLGPYIHNLPMLLSQLTQTPLFGHKALLLTLLEVIQDRYHSEMKNEAKHVASIFLANNNDFFGDKPPNASAERNPLGCAENFGKNATIESPFSSVPRLELISTGRNAQFQYVEPIKTTRPNAYVHLLRSFGFDLDNLEIAEQNDEEGQDLSKNGQDNNGGAKIPNMLTAHMNPRFASIYKYLNSQVPRTLTEVIARLIVKDDNLLETLLPITFCQENHHQNETQNSSNTSPPNPPQSSSNTTTSPDNSPSPHPSTKSTPQSRHLHSIFNNLSKTAPMIHYPNLNSHFILRIAHEFIVKNHNSLEQSKHSSNSFDSLPKNQSPNPQIHQNTEIDPSALINSPQNKPSKTSVLDQTHILLPKSLFSSYFTTLSNTSNLSPKFPQNLLFKLSTFILSHFNASALPPKSSTSLISLDQDEDVHDPYLVHPLLDPDISPLELNRLLKLPLTQSKNDVFLKRILQPLLSVNYQMSWPPVQFVVNIENMMDQIDLQKECDLKLYPQRILEKEIQGQSAEKGGNEEDINKQSNENGGRSFGAVENSKKDESLIHIVYKNEPVDGLCTPLPLISNSILKNNEYFIATNQQDDNFGGNSHTQIQFPDTNNNNNNNHNNNHNFFFENRNEPMQYDKVSYTSQFNLITDKDPELNFLDPFEMTVFGINNSSKIAQNSFQKSFWINELYDIEKLISMRNISSKANHPSPVDVSSVGYVNEELISENEGGVIKKMRGNDNGGEVENDFGQNNSPNRENEGKDDFTDVKPKWKKSIHEKERQRLERLKNNPNLSKKAQKRLKRLREKLQNETNSNLQNSHQNPHQNSQIFQISHNDDEYEQTLSVALLELQQSKSVAIDMNDKRLMDTNLRATERYSTNMTDDQINKMFFDSDEWEHDFQHKDASFDNNKKKKKLFDKKKLKSHSKGLTSQSEHDNDIDNNSTDNNNCDGVVPNRLKHRKVIRRISKKKNSQNEIMQEKLEHNETFSSSKASEMSSGPNSLASLDQNLIFPTLSLNDSNPSHNLPLFDKKPFPSPIVMAVQSAQTMAVFLHIQTLSHLLANEMTEIFSLYFPLASFRCCNLCKDLGVCCGRGIVVLLQELQILFLTFNTVDLRQMGGNNKEVQRNDKGSHRTSGLLFMLANRSAPFGQFGAGLDSVDSGKTNRKEDKHDETGEKQTEGKPTSSKPLLSQQSPFILLTHFINCCFYSTIYSYLLDLHRYKIINTNDHLDDLTSPPNHPSSRSSSQSPSPHPHLSHEKLIYPPVPVNHSDLFAIITKTTSKILSCSKKNMSLFQIKDANFNPFLPPKKRLVHLRDGEIYRPLWGTIYEPLLTPCSVEMLSQLEGKPGEFIISGDSGDFGGEKRPNCANVSNQTNFSSFFEEFLSMNTTIDSRIDDDHDTDIFSPVFGGNNDENNDAEFRQKSNNGQNFEQRNKTNSDGDGESFQTISSLLQQNDTDGDITDFSITHKNPYSALLTALSELSTESDNDAKSLLKNLRSRNQNVADSAKNPPQKPSRWTTTRSKKVNLAKDLLDGNMTDRIGIGTFLSNMKTQAMKRNIDKIFLNNDIVSYEIGDQDLFDTDSQDDVDNENDVIDSDAYASTVETSEPNVINTTRGSKSGYFSSKSPSNTKLSDNARGGDDDDDDDDDDNRNRENLLLENFFKPILSHNSSNSGQNGQKNREKRPRSSILREKSPLIMFSNVPKSLFGSHLAESEEFKERTRFFPYTLPERLGNISDVLGFSEVDLTANNSGDMVDDVRGGSDGKTPAQFVFGKYYPVHVALLLQLLHINTSESFDQLPLFVHRQTNPYPEEVVLNDQIIEIGNNERKNESETKTAQNYDNFVLPSRDKSSPLFLYPQKPSLYYIMLMTACSTSDSTDFNLPPLLSYFSLYPGQYSHQNAHLDIYSAVLSQYNAILRVCIYVCYQKLHLPLILSICSKFLTTPSATFPTLVQLIISQTSPNSHFNNTKLTNPTGFDRSIPKTHSYCRFLDTFDLSSVLVKHEVVSYRRVFFLLGFYTFVSGPYLSRLTRPDIIPRSTYSASTSSIIQDQLIMIESTEIIHRKGKTTTEMTEFESKKNGEEEIESGKDESQNKQKIAFEFFEFSKNCPHTFELWICLNKLTNFHLDMVISYSYRGSISSLYTDIDVGDYFNAQLNPQDEKVEKSTNHKTGQTAPKKKISNRKEEKICFPVYTPSIFQLPGTHIVFPDRFIWIPYNLRVNSFINTGLVRFAQSNSQGNFGKGLTSQGDDSYCNHNSKFRPAFNPQPQPFFPPLYNLPALYNSVNYFKRVLFAISQPTQLPTQGQVLLHLYFSTMIKTNFHFFSTLCNFDHFFSPKNPPKIASNLHFSHFLSTISQQNLSTPISVSLVASDIHSVLSNSRISLVVPSRNDPNLLMHKKCPTHHFTPQNGSKSRVNNTIGARFFSKQLHNAFVYTLTKLSFGITMVPLHVIERMIYTMEDINIQHRFGVETMISNFLTNQFPNKPKKQNAFAVFSEISPNSKLFQFEQNLSNFDQTFLIQNNTVFQRPYGVVPNNGYSNMTGWDITLGFDHGEGNMMTDRINRKGTGENIPHQNNNANITSEKTDLNEFLISFQMINNSLILIFKSIYFQFLIIFLVEIFKIPVSFFAGIDLLDIMINNDGLLLRIEAMIAQQYEYNQAFGIIPEEFDIEFVTNLTRKQTKKDKKRQKEHEERKEQEERDDQNDNQRTSRVNKDQIGLNDNTPALNLPKPLKLPFFINLCITTMRELISNKRNPPKNSNSFHNSPTNPSKAQQSDQFPPIVTKKTFLPILLSLYTLRHHFTLSHSNTAGSIPIPIRSVFHNSEGQRKGSDDQGDEEEELNPYPQNETDYQRYQRYQRYPNNREQIANFGFNSSNIDNSHSASLQSLYSFNPLTIHPVLKSHISLQLSPKLQGSLWRHETDINIQDFNFQFLAPNMHNPIILSMMTSPLAISHRFGIFNGWVSVSVMRLAQIYLKQMIFSHLFQFLPLFYHPFLPILFKIPYHIMDPSHLLIIDRSKGIGLDANTVMGSLEQEVLNITTHVSCEDEELFDGSDDNVAIPSHRSGEVQNIDANKHSDNNILENGQILHENSFTARYGKDMVVYSTVEDIMRDFPEGISEMEGFEKDILTRKSDRNNIGQRYYNCNDPLHSPGGISALSTSALIGLDKYLHFEKDYPPKSDNLQPFMVHLIDYSLSFVPEAQNGIQNTQTEEMGIKKNFDTHNQSRKNSQTRDSPSQQSEYLAYYTKHGEFRYPLFLPTAETLFSGCINGRNGGKSYGGCEFENISLPHEGTFDEFFLTLVKPFLSTYTHTSIIAPVDLNMYKQYQKHCISLINTMIDISDYFLTDEDGKHNHMVNESAGTNDGRIGKLNSISLHLINIINFTSNLQSIADKLSLKCSLLLLSNLDTFNVNGIEQSPPQQPDQFDSSPQNDKNLKDHPENSKIHSNSSKIDATICPIPPPSYTKPYYSLNSYVLSVHNSLTIMSSFSKLTFPFAILVPQLLHFVKNSHTINSYRNRSYGVNAGFTVKAESGEKNTTEGKLKGEDDNGGEERNQSGGNNVESVVEDDTVNVDTITELYNLLQHVQFPLFSMTHVGGINVENEFYNLNYSLEHKQHSQQPLKRTHQNDGINSEQQQNYDLTAKISNDINQVGPDYNIGLSSRPHSLFNTVQIETLQTSTFLSYLFFAFFASNFSTIVFNTFSMFSHTTNTPLRSQNCQNGQNVENQTPDHDSKRFQILHHILTSPLTPSHLRDSPLPENEVVYNPALISKIPLKIDQILWNLFILSYLFNVSLPVLFFSICVPILKFAHIHQSYRRHCHLIRDLRRQRVVDFQMGLLMAGNDDIDRDQGKIEQNQSKNDENNHLSHDQITQHHIEQNSSSNDKSSTTSLLPARKHHRGDEYANLRSQESNLEDISVRNDETPKQPTQFTKQPTKKPTLLVSFLDKEFRSESIPSSYSFPADSSPSYASNSSHVIRDALFRTRGIDKGFQINTTLEMLMARLSRKLSPNKQSNNTGGFNQDEYNGSKLQPSRLMLAWVKKVNKYLLYHLTIEQLKDPENNAYTSPMMLQRLIKDAPDEPRKGKTPLWKSLSVPIASLLSSYFDAFNRNKSKRRAGPTTVKYTRTYQSYAKPQRAGKQKLAHKHMFVSKMDRKRHRKNLEKDNGFDGWDVGLSKNGINEVVQYTSNIRNGQFVNGFRDGVDGLDDFDGDFEDFEDFEGFQNSNSNNLHEYQHQDGFPDSGDDYSIDEDCEEDSFSDESD